MFFSPEVAPATDATAPTFNLNTISQGMSTADFYLAVPISADSTSSRATRAPRCWPSRSCAAREGQKVSLNLGEDVPIPTTTFTPLATGGAATSPLTSFGYRTIGIIVEMTPRVTYEGDIILDLSLENSARGGDVIIAGQALPAFNSRKVTTRLRLRDGESEPAGRAAARGRAEIAARVSRAPAHAGDPAAVRQQRHDGVTQTDIVMLLTPRIVRSHELTPTDLAPIYIGPQSNLSLGGGPPPLINVPPAGEPPVVIGGTPAPPVAAARRRFRPAVHRCLARLCRRRRHQPRRRRRTDAAGRSAADRADAGIIAARAAARSGAGATPTPPPRRSQPPAGRWRRADHARAAPEMRVGAGPYTVPVSISGASRLSTLSMSITYNPCSGCACGACRKARSCGRAASPRRSTSQNDSAAGRVDIVITRPSDQTGAVGTGLLAAVLFEPVAAGMPRSR